MPMIHEYRAGLLAALFVLGVLLAPAAIAADRAALDRDALRTYGSLVAGVPAAKALAKDAPAVLVFPEITKAGRVVGGQYGEVHDDDARTDTDFEAVGLIQRAERGVIHEEHRVTR